MAPNKDGCHQEFEMDMEQFSMRSETKKSGFTYLVPASVPEMSGDPELHAPDDPCDSDERDRP